MTDRLDDEDGTRRTVECLERDVARLRVLVERGEDGPRVRRAFVLVAQRAINWLARDEVRSIVAGVLDDKLIP